jgi:hypothetical protein
MSDVTFPVKSIDIPEARVRAAHVRDQLRLLEQELEVLASDVEGPSDAAVGRLERAALNVRRAVAEICIDAQQSPF